MLKSIGAIGIAASVILLAACQSLNTNLSEINDELSKISGQKSGSALQSQSTLQRARISNSWGVSDSEALAWLKHSKYMWNDGGKIKKGVNWYNFWEKQLKSKTLLSKNAYQVCKADTAGANCETYWQAYSMSASSGLVY